MPEGKAVDCVGVAELEPNSTGDAALLRMLCGNPVCWRRLKFCRDTKLDGLGGRDDGAEFGIIERGSIAVGIGTGIPAAGNNCDASRGSGSDGGGRINGTSSCGSRFGALFTRSPSMAEAQRLRDTSVTSRLPETSIGDGSAGADGGVPNGGE